MEKGDFVKTPRFCTVRISAMFPDKATAFEQGYHEPTHYNNASFDIFGKHTGLNTMVFAAVKK